MPLAMGPRAHVRRHCAGPPWLNRSDLAPRGASGAETQSGLDGARTSPRWPPNRGRVIPNAGGG
jgi:hypothetical protein